MTGRPQQSGGAEHAANVKRRRQILFVSELYHPEDAATAFFITRIAEGLAEHHDVRVYCAQPTYHQRHLRCAKRQERCGVKIKRCFSARFDRSRVLLRALNILTFCTSVLLNLLARARRNDLIVVGTNPPFLPGVCWLISAVKGTPFILRIEDLYPQVMAAAGFTSPTSPAYRLARAFYARVLARAKAVVVLGRDMRERLAAEYGSVLGNGGKLVVVPNWGEEELLSLPSTKQTCLNGLDFSGEFVVLFAGNLGRVQDLETIVTAAEMLRSDPVVRFLIVGSGSKRAWLSRQVAARSLQNVTLLDQLPRTEQAKFLSVCDVGLVSLIPSMSGVSVPSRTYNLLAAGKPVIALVESGSEIGRLIAERNVGWRVDPGCPAGFSAIITELRGNPALVAEYGRNAREAVRQQYNLPEVMRAYRELLSTCASPVLR